MTARRASEDSILVLQAHQIEVREIQKVGGLLVGRQIVLRKRQPHTLRVGIPGLHVIDRDRRLGRATLSGDRVAQSVVKVAIPHCRGR